MVISRQIYLLLQPDCMRYLLRMGNECCHSVRKQITNESVVCNKPHFWYG